MYTTFFLLKSFNRALQGKYKDQTEDASLTTDVTKLDEGVAMSRPHLTPNSELGAQTGPANSERTPLHKPV
jgi:hypothetical protein